MGATSVAACAVMLAICLPAVCQGQQYWGGYGWRPVWQPSVGAVCDRAYPVNEASTVRTSCRYPCQGWPVRYGNEEDGTPCQLSGWRQGSCFRGRCQRQYLLPVVPRDEDNNVEGRQDSVRFLMCRNWRQRVKVGGVVRSCQFVCKQRRNSFLANEDNGTPCLAWGGNVGYCDQGMCKAAVPTVAPTAAQTTSAKLSTTPQLPVASSVTTPAPAVTAQATEEDVSLAQTGEPATAVTGASTQAPATAAPAARPPWRPGFVGVKCDRAYPARVTNGRAAKCRFLCRGYPSLGIGFEEDGTPCWRKKTLEGVCFDGKCQPVPVATAATTAQEERTTTGPTTTRTDAVTATGAGEQSTPQLTAGTEGVETLSTSTTSGVPEGDHTNTGQGTTVNAAETTTAKSEFVATEQQASSSDEQATTANSAPGAGDEASTEGNVSEPAPTAETAVSETTESNAGHSVEEVTIAQQQTTGESVSKGTTVPEDAADVAGTEQAGTPSGDEVTTQSEGEGDDAQDTTAAGEATGEDEEGSGNFEGLPTSEAIGQEATITTSSSAEGAVAAVSETDAVIVDSSTQSAAEGSADDVKFGTEEPHTSRAAPTTTGLEATSEGGVDAEDASSPTETEVKAQSSTSAVTEGVFEEVTQTRNLEKEVAAEVTEASQENPSATPAHENDDADRAVTEVVSSIPGDDEDATAASHAVTSDTQQEVTEGVTLATTGEAAEATTATGETATAKVITVVTRKEIVRPVGSDADQSDLTVVDSTRDTYVETLPVSELNETVAPSKAEPVVSASSDNSDVATDETNAGAAAGSTDGVLVNEPEAVATTAFAVEVAQTEQVVTELPETKAVPVIEEATEGTAAADESATVKVITTITQKEITRPIEGDASQPEETSVDTERTTSVETLPLSEVDKTSSSDVTAAAESSESVTDSLDHTVSASSDNSDVATDETNARAAAGSTDGVLVNEPEAVATTAFAVEVVQTEQVVTELPQTKVVPVIEETTEGTAAADESATVKVITTITQKETTRPIEGDASQPEATSVDTERTTSVEALPLSEVDKTSASDVTAAAESSESVTDSLVHTATAVAVAAQPVAGATTSAEEVSQVQQDPSEVSSVAVANEASESTTVAAAAAAAESATVKVITTITHKEIVRPVESDDSQSDANVVDSSKTTSVETLPASEFEEASKSSPTESEVASPSETSVASNDNTAASDTVSSGPSIVITDFVQKTASSSKDSVTAPSTEEQATALP